MTNVDRTKLVSTLESLVEANLQNEQFGVEELAEGVGMSRSHLHRKLKKATGQSVSQFIREYRLQKAHQLLQTEGLTSAEVAYQVGFSSPTYFSTAFRELYGYPPGEARQKEDTPEAPAEERKPDPDPDRGRRVRVAVGVGLFGVIAGLLLFLLWPNEVPVDRPEVREKSIAVLPFKNLSSEEDNQYFADGVMDAVLNKLAGVRELKVTSRTSVEKYRDNTSLTVPEIADELSVTYILEGSAQKYGDQIRIITQLINAAADEHLWSRDYTRQFEDVLYLQSEIAEQVTAELETVLTSDEQVDLREIATEVPEAYNYFLLAEFQAGKWTSEGFRNSIPLYWKAIQADSNYVDPYVGLAFVWSTGGAVWGIYDEREAWDNCRSLLEKALEIDPDHIDALETLASGYFYYDWNIQQPLEYFTRAKEQRGHYGFLAMDYLIKVGKADAALETSEEFIASDPSNSGHYLFRAQSLYLLGRVGEAIHTLDEASRLYDDILFVREAAKMYYLFGEIDKFKAVLEKFKRLFPDRPPIIKWLEAAYAFHEGEDPTAYLNELQAQYQQRDSGSPAWFLALSYAGMGEEATTFEWLEKSYRRHEVEMTWLKTEPVLEPYRPDPRYQKLLDRMDFPE